MGVVAGLTITDASVGWPSSLPLSLPSGSIAGDRIVVFCRARGGPGALGSGNTAGFGLSATWSQLLFRRWQMAGSPWGPYGYGEEHAVGVYTARVGDTGLLPQTIRPETAGGAAVTPSLPATWPSWGITVITIRPSHAIITATEATFSTTYVPSATGSPTFAWSTGQQFVQWTISAPPTVASTPSLTHDASLDKATLPWTTRWHGPSVFVSGWSFETVGDTLVADTVATGSSSGRGWALHLNARPGGASWPGYAVLLALGDPDRPVSTWRPRAHLGLHVHAWS